MICKNIFGEVKILDDKIFNNKTIGISMSGGADSTMLCYLCAMVIEKNNLNIKIQPFNGLDIHASADSKNLPDIIKFIRQKFSKVDIRWPISTVYSNPKLESVKNEYINDLTHTLETYKVYDIFVCAITLGPPIDIQKKFNTIDHNTILRLKGYDLYNELIDDRNNNIKKPFNKIDKRFIIQSYKDHNIEELLNMTESCIIVNKCKKDKCWWCAEREWAMNEVYND